VPSLSNFELEIVRDRARLNNTTQGPANSGIPAKLFMMRSIFQTILEETQPGDVSLSTATTNHQLSFMLRGDIQLP
jgi:hypothetical protein